MRRNGTNRSLIVYAFLSVLIVASTQWFVVTKSDRLAKDAPQILSREGYSDVQVKGYSFLGCGRDVLSVSFTGVKNGQPVSGNVCKNFGSGAVIRIR